MPAEECCNHDCDQSDTCPIRAFHEFQRQQQPTAAPIRTAIDPTHEIIPISRIGREAEQAAQKYDCIDAACPYPFSSEAGQLFKLHFLAARKNMAEKAFYALPTGTNSYPKDSETP